MNKFNKLGMEVIDFKTEFLKNYPPIVHESLGVAIDKKRDDSIISDMIHDKLLDSTVSLGEFKSFLLKEEPSCLKTYAELLQEYEDIRMSFTEALQEVLSKDNVDTSLFDAIKTCSKVESEEIFVQQEFIITEEFINNYFLIESEKDFEVLMSRKGFIEKFAVLRLVRILKDFLDKQEDSCNYELHNSPVFFAAERNVYGIYLEFKIPIALLESEEQQKELSEIIAKIMEDANKNFHAHMLV